MIEEHFVISKDARHDIRAFAAYVQSIVERRTEALLADTSHNWQHLFETTGDMAYGKFNALLFQPLRKPFADAGLKPSPRLPGSFQSSREWGNADETHQQRWFYSTIVTADGGPLGAVAVGAHHDHQQFRLPRSLEILAVRATTPAAIEKEIGTRLPEYAIAKPFRQWWKDYQSEEAAESEVSPLK